jgi:hypothetical protein
MNQGQFHAFSRRNLIGGAGASGDTPAALVCGLPPLAAKIPLQARDS